MSNRYMPAAFLALLAVLACTVTFPSAQAITGSGNLVTIEREESGFDRLEISHAFEAEVRQSDSYRVIVHIDDNLQEYLRVERVGQTLEVGLELRGPADLRQATLRAEIAMPTLSAVEASGASHVTLTGFASDGRLAATASGASSIRGEIEAGQVRADVSGASLIELVGACSSLAMDVSGASAAELLDFECGDVSVVVSGASNAVVFAAGTLGGEVSGASNLEYAGNPTRQTVTTSGASNVEEH